MDNTTHDTSDIYVPKTTNSPWTFKQFINNLFRRKRNIDKLNQEPKENPKINGQLLEQVKIHNTPFTAVRFENHWFLTLGRYRLTNQLNSLKECEAEAQDASWLRLMQVIKIVIEDHDNEKRLEQTVEKQKLQREMAQ